jgi:tetratricopeptide (TPR) repeat protein
VNKKTVLGLFVFLLLSGTGWAQRQIERPYWFILEQGKQYLKNGDYGDALLAFEDARRLRRGMYTRMERDMIELLSIPEVRRLEDSLDQVEQYIADRNRLEAAAALRELYYRLPRESLGGSARKALEQFDRLKNYPEAEYWIGEVYRIEGELSIALSQYQRALEQREFLENAGFDLEILYKIAGIHRLRQEYTEMERRLLEILEQDSLWFGESRILFRNAMMKTLENNGINRFLTVYRYTNPLVERAHRLLGYFYYASGRYSRAEEHLLFAFLIQNSVLMEEIIRRRFDFTFSSLNDLMGELTGRPELLTYLADTEYYKTVYYFGAALYGNGKANSAQELWGFLNGQAAAGEWRTRSVIQLRSPFVERIQEMP